MKLLIIFILNCFIISIKSQELNDLDKNKATIYILRSTGYIGSGFAYSTFIDNSFLCRVNNKKYLTFKIDPGVHTFSIRAYGRKEKSKSKKIIVNIESGKTIYLSIIQIHDFLLNTIYFFDEVTEETAKYKLKELCKDEKCN